MQAARARCLLRKTSCQTDAVAKPAIHWMFAEDIDAAYQELQSLGANIVDPLEKKPWGFTGARVAVPGLLFISRVDCIRALKRVFTTKAHDVWFFTKAIWVSPLP